MQSSKINDLNQYCLEVAQRAKSASMDLAQTTGNQKILWLRNCARMLLERSGTLIEANQLDIDKASDYGLSPAAVDRLRLTTERIAALAKALEEVAVLPEPIGQIISSSIRPNGLEVQKVRVPLGVIFFIYESRPNVTADAASICVKSGNAVILRGGKESIHSNTAIVQILAEAAAEAKLPADAIQLLQTPDRQAVGHLLRMPQYIDLCIPRGGESLIRRVSEEAKMPVIKHFAGNCHVYLDKSADPAMAEKIVINAKCQRMGVCNAAESLLIHADAAEALLPRVAKALSERGIDLRADDVVRRLLPEAKPATEDDYRAEYL
ncbi:MAG: glutamate-5-semialdehyde dehydrogenase, partial [Thermoguttaceae bacterium]